MIALFRYLKARRLFSDAFWVIAGQALSATALLAGTRMLTELVSPGVYGQVALLNGFVALGVALFSYPFICAGMRMIPECRTPRERGVLKLAVAGLTARSTALATVLLLAAGLFDHYRLSGHFILYALSGLLLIVTVKRELGIQLLIGERNQRSASLWQTCDSLLRPFSAILLVFWGGQEPEWVLLGYLLAIFLSNSVWSFNYLGESSRNQRPAAVRNFKNEVWRYALPLIPIELIFWINGLGDRYVIGWLLSAADVGLYAAVYLIVNEAFNRSAMVLLRIFQPVYFQNCARHQWQEGYKILWLWIACVLAMSAIGTVAAIVGKEWIVSWLLAESYHSAADLIPAIAFGCALHALGTALSQPLLAEKRTRLLLCGRCSGALTAAISIPLMVIHYGLPGAALANCLYFGVEALVLALLAKPWRIVGPKRRGGDTDQIAERIEDCEMSA